jgi:hypothetical protein
MIDIFSSVTAFCDMLEIALSQLLVCYDWIVKVFFFSFFLCIYIALSRSDQVQPTFFPFFFFFHDASHFWKIRLWEDGSLYLIIYTVLALEKVSF